MKKKIISIAFSLVMGMTAGFAAGNKSVHDETVTSFTKDFSGAKEVKWQKQKEYDMATFSLNGMVMMAYYNDHAMLVAVIHNVLTDNLPIYLLTDLKNNYSNYWITELFEGASGGESHFHIKLENADETIAMKSENSTDWVLERRVKKA